MNRFITNNSNRRFGLSFICLLTVYFLLSAEVSRAQETRAPEQSIPDSITNIDSLNDGPHVFLKDDTTAIVFYLCDEELLRETRYGHDTVKFNGLCGDSDREYTAAFNCHRDTTYRFENVSRIFTVSDIHGEYEYFKDILIKAGVIDSVLHWTWGDGHLVVLGDIFDRGSRVTECLWLVYQLKQEAPGAGGRVHFVLGNHELMVLRGDDRYVHDRYVEGIVKKTRIKYEDLYGSDMVLGRWLRVQPTVITINNLLFVHGGLTPELVTRQIDPGYINRIVAGGLDISSGRLAFDDDVKYLFGSYGPFWYRGYHYAMEDRYDRADSDEIDRLLNFYGVNQIVVGHSEHDRIELLYDRRVVAVDVPVEDLDGFQGLLWERGQLFKVQPDGTRKQLK